MPPIIATSLLAVFLTLPWQAPARAEGVPTATESAIDTTAPPVPTSEESAAAYFGMLESLLTGIGELELLVTECERRRLPGAGPARQALASLGSDYAAPIEDARRALGHPQAGRRLEQMQAALASQARQRAGAPATELRRQCREAAGIADGLNVNLFSALVILDFTGYRASAALADGDTDSRREKALASLYGMLMMIENLAAECERRGLTEAKSLRQMLARTRGLHPNEWRQAEQALDRSPLRTGWRVELMHAQRRNMTILDTDMPGKCAGRTDEVQTFELMEQLLLGGRQAAAAPALP